MEDPLLIFVSSVISGMEAERQAAHAGIQAIPLTRPWLFEFSSASSLPLAESYLSKVRACDIFVLLLQDRVTDPVKLEVETAQTADKPLLVFLNDGAPADVVAYARSLGVKYATFTGAQDLAPKVAEAVGDELITGYRRHNVPRSDLGGIGDFLDGLAQGRVQINIRGSYVGGSVTVESGGTFVGGNQINLISPEAESLDDLLRAYYCRLAEECRRLPLGVIDKEFVHTSGEQPVPLPDIYVDLHVVAPAEERGRGKATAADERAWALRLARGEGSDRTPLLEAVSRPKVTRTVLLGDAGSGKTTFVNYLAYLLASDPAMVPEPLRGLLPVRLALREVVARHVPANAAHGTAQMLWDALVADVAACLGTPAAAKLFPFLQARLLREGAFVLLDGLDEVPEARRRRAVLLEAIRDLADTFAKTPARFLVTARPYAYAEQQWRLPAFSTLALAPFDEKQVRRFIERWYQAVRPAMGWNQDTARGKGDRLRTALQERSYLGDLASRPLLLTLMATLHSSWGQLPEDRADLYEETVELLLGRWQRAREIRRPDGELEVEPGITQALGVGEERIRAALETLAFNAHDRQRRGPERDEGPADIAEGDLLVAFKPLLGRLGPEELLRYLRDRAGLIVARKEGVYAFPHRSFQEYLAACHLANQPGLAEKLRSLACDDLGWWREVYLLGAGKARQGGLGQAVQVVNTLIPEAPEDVEKITDLQWRLAALAGQALVELRLPEKAAGQPHFEAVLKRTRRWLVRLVEEGHLSASERATAGDVLGQLGDPRFDPNCYFLSCRYRGEPEPRCGFVEVPAGPFVMGSRKGDKGAYDDEVGNPPRLVIPYRYWIARYPVTVAQFGVFVQDGGYETDRWWTPQGWAWRRGEWDSQVKEDWLEDWLKTRPRDQRSAPMWWNQQRSDLNRPVMGVSWFEAMAYCAWLDTRLRSRAAWIPAGYAVRLPTEAEWEKAARSSSPSPAAAGEGSGVRAWPWGNEDWDEDRANIERWIGRPSAVGIYPRGATPTGLHDLSGNVWEWTLSLARDYPYRPDDGRNDPQAEGARVVRGGSWDYDRRYARCACRNWDVPADFYHNVGLRVVVSLSSSGF